MKDSGLIFKAIGALLKPGWSVTGVSWDNSPSVQFFSPKRELVVHRFIDGDGCIIFTTGPLKDKTIPIVNATQP